MKKRRYAVSRTHTETEYCEVGATSEKEAIELAKTLGEDKWETNPNDEYLDYYDYNAEEE